MDLLVFDNSGASCAVLMLVLPGSSTTASAKCNKCPTDGATHDRMFSCQTSISVALLMCCYQDLSPNIASMINDHKDAAETTVAVRHLLETCTQRQRQPQPQRQESLQWLACLQVRFQHQISQRTPGQSCDPRMVQCPIKPR